MAELLVLAAFTAAIFLTVVLDVSILYALIVGLILFFAYGICRGHSFSAVLKMALGGVKTVKDILLTFFLIGAITGVWRLCGTVPYIVYHAAGLFDPRAMVLITFLLCCAVSFLTGTSFGTAATMGVICAAVAGSMGIPAVYTGGAILSGCYFGDRCSPMSTSALLVSSVTKTDIFRNVANMMKTAAVPFVLSCGVYACLGFGFEGVGDPTAVETLFARHFSLHPAAIIPAAAILILSLFKVKVKLTMSVSVLCGALVALLVEKASFAALLSAALAGYYPESGELSALLSGGGVVSMAKVFCIVCLSASFSGISRGTGLLDGFQEKITRLSRRITPYGSFLLTAGVISIISCSQALAILLTHQLCKDTEADPYRTASYLEDTAVVLAPLVPWGVAGAVPLAAVGAPVAAISTACYLYILPFWSLLANLLRERKTKRKATA